MSAPVPELMEQVADRFLILDRGRVTAEGTLDELRSTSRCPGSLAEVLERIMYPQAREHLERYFEAEHK
jgi:ABC-2 type transport system ATP-binding protein